MVYKSIENSRLDITQLGIKGIMDLNKNIVVFFSLLIFTGISASQIYADEISAGTYVNDDGPVAIVFTKTTATYDGTEQSVEFTIDHDIPEEFIEVTYNGLPGLPVDAGTYNAVVNITQEGYESKDSTDFIIAKALATIELSELTWTYDGTEKNPSATTNPSGLIVDFIYDEPEPPTDAGSYEFEAFIQDDNYYGSVLGILTINPIEVEVTVTGLDTIYTGEPIEISVVTAPVVAYEVNYIGNVGIPVNAGSYPFEIILDENYTGSTTNGVLEISKAEANIQLSNLTHNYNGNAKTATATTTPSGLDVVITYDESGPPSQVGTYVVKAVIQDDNYYGSTIGTLTIAATEVEVTISDLNATYNGEPFAVTVITDPAVPYEVTYGGSPTPPTNAGSYLVVVTLEEGYIGGATGTMEIEKKELEILLTNLNQVYDGTPKPVTATTSEAGVIINITYDGGVEPPSAVDSYIVEATIQGDNYYGSASGTLTINAREVDVNLSGLVIPYSGEPIGVTVTTDPVVPYEVTYGGSPTPPTDAGSYLVVVTLEEGYTGGATGTLEIEKAEAVVELDDLEQPYDGTIKEVTVSTVPPGLTVDVDYEGDELPPVKVGQYDVSATIVDKNRYGSTEDVLTITANTATITIENLKHTYNGETKEPDITIDPENLSYKVLYNGGTELPVNAGSYEVRVEITEEGYEGTETAEMVIKPAPATVILGNLEHDYDGTPKIVTYTTDPPDLPATIDYGDPNTPPSAVGSYPVMVTIDAPNHEGFAEGTLTISTSTVGITIEDLLYTFDGDPKEPTITLTDDVSYEVTYSGETDPPSNAGTYNIVVTITEPGYEGTKTATLVIEKAPASIELSNFEHQFNGTPKSVSYSTTPPGLPVKISYDGKPELPILLGSYDVVATIDSNNFHAEAATGTLTIGASNVEITLSGLNHVYNGDPKPVTVKTIPEGISFVVTYNGNTNPPTVAGTYEVIVKINQEGYAGTKSGTMVITKAEATIELQHLVQTYDGSPKPVSGITTPPNLPITYKYDGNSDEIPVNAGEYQVEAEINDPNHFGSAEGTLIINKRTAPITITNLLQNYDGEAKTVNIVTNPAGLSTKVTYNNSPTLPINQGTYQVKAEIEDANYQGNNTATLVINGPPVAGVIPAININEDSPPYELPLNEYFSDIETPFNDLNFSIIENTNDKLFSTITFQTNRLVLGFKPNLNGTAQIKIRATDANGLFAETTLTVNIRPVNDAPEFTSSPVRTVNQNSEYSYLITSEDIDNPVSDLTISAMTLPGWLTFSGGENGTATLKGTPGNDHVGTHTVVLIVSDGELTAEQAFPINVININDPPYFESTPPTNAIKNENYTYNIIAKDPDIGDVITVSIIKKPSWLTFQNLGGGTARLSGIPREADINKDNSVTLRITDKAGASVNQSFTIIIISTNVPPYFTSTPITEINEGVLYNYRITTADPDQDDKLKITALSKPNWLTLTDNGDRTAQLHGIADDQDVGTIKIILAVTDAAGVADFQEFNLTVININEPPVFTSNPVLKVKEREEYLYTVRTTDPDINDSWVVEGVGLPSWLTLTLKSKGVHELKGNPAASELGVYQIKLIARDASGLESEQTFTLTVENVNDPPRFTSTPKTLAVLNQEYVYEVTAEDEDPQDVLVLDAVIKPEWLNLTDHGNGTASLSGIPNQAGNYQVSLRVVDYNLEEAIQNFVVVVNTPPQVIDFAKEGMEDQAITFSLIDFTDHFSDQEGKEMTTIQISSLPSHGELRLSNRTLSIEDEIKSSDLDLLIYMPEQDYFGSDEFTWRGSDGDTYSLNAATVSISLTGVNDPPVLSHLESTPLMYVPGKDLSIAITQQLQIIDVDDERMIGAQVIFTNRSYYINEDILEFENIGNITGVFNRDVGSLTFSGEDTKANYERALRSVKYHNVAFSPRFDDRSVNIYVDDWKESSNFVRREITMVDGLVELVIPSGFTPNNGSVNNFWIIKNIQLYPNCEVNVFSRNGSLIFKSLGYNDPWDGTYNGSNLPVGTYYYIIKLNEFNKTYTGTVTIIR